MKKYAKKEVEIIEDERILIGSQQSYYFIEELSQTGKTILFVSHAVVLNPLWSSLISKTIRSV